MNFIKNISLFISCLCFCCACTSNAHVQQKSNTINFSGDPILPGDFADPCILIYRDTFYIYATTGAEATVWRSADFVNWKLTVLSWPTAMHLPDIWAPSVRQGLDGKFYLYTTVNHNIYAGVADHPLGPFRNALPGDSIFIKNRILSNKMHSIDADCFIDDDGQAYLYWGSGFEFKDGVCAVGRLNKDMASFKESPKLITPEGYFEGSHMLKRNGKYYLMYSDGLYYDSTYKVRYAVADNPLGPFTQGKNSPVLTSTPDGVISGPGHHYTFKSGNDYYIVYHRHSYPFYEGQRQVCIDKLAFENDGAIKKVTATQKGVPLSFTKVKAVNNVLQPAAVQASASLSKSYDAAKAFDGSFGTLWSVDAKALPAILQADFRKPITIKSCTPVFDNVMGDYNYTIEYSPDSKQWLQYEKSNNANTAEWPAETTKTVQARFIKLTILSCNKAYNRVGLWELQIR